MKKYSERFLTAMFDKDVIQAINETNLFYIDIKDGEVSYLEKSKAEKIKGNRFWSKRRVNTRIGRFLNKYTNLPQVEVEKLSNKIKAMSHKGEIKVMDNVNWAYLEDNYYESKGTLGGSCMKPHKCQRYFDIYNKNDNVKIAVMIKDNKVQARALLWSDVAVGGGSFDKKIMDRVYFSEDWQKRYMQIWGLSNGYIVRDDCSSGASEMFVKTIEDLMNSDISYLSLEVEVDTEHDFYPYSDTFHYMSYGFLSNNDDDYEHELSSTGGSTSGGYFSDYDDCYYHEEDCTWCDYHNTYISNEDAVYVQGEVYHENDCDYDEIDSCWILEEDRVCLSDGRVTHVDNTVKCEDGDIELCSDCEYSEYYHEYIQKEKSVMSEDGLIYENESVVVDGELRHESEV